MALAYRAGSFVSAGNASGGDLTLTKPTGTADGDRVVIVVYFEPDTTTITVSPGTWESVTIANTGAFKLQAFTKIAASEPASYTIANNTAGNQWRSAVGAAYSGGSGSGTTIDVSGTAQADGVTPVSNQTAPSVTTTGADRMLVFGYGNFSGANPSATTGAATNFRGVLGGVVIADALRATAGATGTTYPSAGAHGTEDYAALHVALISDIAGGPTPISGADTGTATDATGALAAAVAGAAEAATATDARSALAASAAAADSAAATEAVALALAAADAATLADTATALVASASATEAATATDGATGAPAVAASDSAAATDSGSLFVGLDVAATDSAAATDATGALAASAAATDTGAGADAVLSVVAAVPATDAATATDTGSVFAGQSVSASDGAAGTDAVLAVAAAVAAAEGATGSDAAALALAASDAAAMTEAGSVADVTNIATVTGELAGAWSGGRAGAWSGGRAGAWSGGRKGEWE